MNMTHEKNILLNIVAQHPKVGKTKVIGKTKVMKIVFMLQQVKQLDMDYEFSIYTYGPYSSEVTDNLDELISDGFITANMYPYNNYVGYELQISSKGENSLQGLDDSEKSAINDVLNFVDGKNAKDLELYSTIIYVDNFYARVKGSVPQKDIVSKVHEIKPHFDKSVIDDAFQELQNTNYIATQ